MEITLNNVKTLDQLKGIIATKYPWVKMHSDYLSLKYQGVKLTIEPKKNGIYDINKDVPTPLFSRLVDCLYDIR